MYRTATGLTLVLASLGAQAALLGRAPATPGGSDYQAYYDTDLNVTWWHDANYANSTGYSNGLYAVDYGGGMYWADAVTWADQLILGGLSDWYLPTQAQMGHLHYDELNHVLYNSVSNWLQINQDPAPFVNIGWNHYWSSESGFIFNFREGTYNSNNSPTQPLLAWAVRTGDIAIVPIPASAWLLGSALGLMGLARGRIIRRSLTCRP